ncbi:uncharacterized protein LOC109801977 [Cajanus cajan]|uniref:uncharacterized protein LOC109801977 n=1 Tax=Cajanus cajan TaxID=3821 RepID=UPI00098D8115|nr:uncharacterized protein LOC109801977 [Cajanus cajan]
MNVLCWNCRGAGNKGFASLVNDMIYNHEVGLLCLLETHISGERAMEVTRRILLEKKFLVHAQGHSGGLWCLWDPKRWNIEVVHHSFQFIHLKVLNDSSHWFCTIVYASPHPQDRIMLWRELTQISKHIDGPWNLVGDFNVVLHQHERMGGALNANLRGDCAFRYFVDQCSLMDIGFNGPPFTGKKAKL